jgi:hypothetical protein
MNPWTRVLVAFAIAVAAGLFLKLLPPVLVLIAFLGGITAVNLRLKGRVKKERATFRSEVVGLRFETRDRFGLLAYPFALFGRCKRAEIEGVRWGAWHELEVKRFDLSYAPAAGEERARLACAIASSASAPLPVAVESTLLSDLLAEPKTATVAVEDLPPDRWVVRCEDPALAAVIVGPSMTSWLSKLEEPWGFEVNGSLALAYGPPSAGIEEPLERVEAFGRLLEEAREARVSQTAPPERPDPTG